MPEMIRRVIALFLMLVSVYLVTYTGRMELADQLEYFDAVGGVARFGQPLADEAMWQTPPRRLRTPDIPLRATIAEPLFIHAAAPVYFAADHLSGVGLVHTVWLFNIVMSPLVVALTFVLGLRIGAGTRGALFAAVALGLLTVWWTYSQTFFREPMMIALMLPLAMALYELPRTSTWIRRALLALASIVIFALAVLTKEAVVFALPGLLMLAIPPRWWASLNFRRLILAGLVAVVAVIFALIYTPVLDWLATALPGGYLFSPSYEIIPETTRIALHTYVLSIGGSIWGTSPVLLLAIPGAWLMWRKNPAYVAAALLIFAGYAVGYGVLRGEGSVGGNWFGGTIWPQRFLLPALPFLILLIAPVWDTLKSRAAQIAVAIICTYSLWWQLSSVVFNWSEYDTVSASFSFGLTYWLPGFNVFEHIRPVALLQAIGDAPLNLAWARADILPYALLFGIPFGISVLALRRNRRAGLLLAASAVMLIIFTYGGLRLLYDRDPYYMPERDDLHQAVALIRETVPTGGAVMVNDPDTTYFWLNYGKVGQRWIIGMPYHPGDRGSFEEPLKIESPDAAQEIAARLPVIIPRFAEEWPRMWLFMDSSSDLPWARRPLERYMGERYYRIDEVYLSSYARLLSYDMTPAPAWNSAGVAEIESPFLFTDPDTGESLRLLGYTLPEGVTTIAPDTPLAVSLVWEADSAPSRDYTAALFVVRADTPSIRAQGSDSWLGATFETTSLIPPNRPIWDNRAVMIPETWTPGEYQLWVKLYFNDYSANRIVDLVPSGGSVTDHNTAILNGTVWIDAE